MNPRLSDVAVAPTDPSVVAPVDYRLAREATLHAWRAGDLTDDEVCDAQRELLRNAEFCGAPTERLCPVCEEVDLVEVMYVFGHRLPKHGRCVSSLREVRRLETRQTSSTGYQVEVCTGCGWNHLLHRRELGSN